MAGRFGSGFPLLDKLSDLGMRQNQGTTLVLVLLVFPLTEVNTLKPPASEVFRLQEPPLAMIMSEAMVMGYFAVSVI